MNLRRHDDMLRGGRARGEVASAEATELIWEWIKREDALLERAVGEA